MTTERVCGKCGAPLTGVGREQLCPGCLLEGGLASAAEAQVALDPSQIANPKSRIENRFPRPFGDYELLEEIARGGMGIVYKARQASLDRMVAVKMLLFGPLAKPEFVQRFRAEAAAAASLRHPNIVAIHEVGYRDGQHFFAMDYVEGQNLAMLVANQPLPARRAAACVKTIAEAIHFAHERGILHRDLKPTNVLIDAATDQPRVTDFGLAKRLDKDTELTLSGQVIGSPNYMPPEQAAAQRGLVGKRSDVYSLGAILYHLLTGRAPFVAETVSDTLQLVRNSDPVSPRALNPSVPRDLETICLKCLEKETGKRYQTAQALADDLGRLLSDEPIQARPVSRLERAWRWCWRKPVIATLSATTALLLMAVAIGSPIAAFHINRERGRAEENAQAEANQRRRADANFQNAREAIDRMFIRVADELAEQPRMEQVRRKLLEDALQFYEGFLRQKGEDPTVQHGAALTYLRVGSIYEMLGQYDQCLEPLGKGIAILEDLAQRHAVEARDREDMAGAHARMARAIFWLRRDLEPAMAHRRKALALYEDLQREFPTVPTYLRAAANAHVDLGNALSAAIGPNEAIVQFRQALQLCEKLRTGLPDAPEDRVVLAHTHHWLGASLELTSRTEEAEREYRAAHDLRQQLVAEQPNRARLKHLLSHIKQYLARLLMKTGRLEEAAELLQGAVALDEKLLEDFPDVGDHRRRAGFTFESLGKVLAALGRPREAEAALRRSMAIWEKLAADIPNVRVHSDELAGRFYDLSVLLETAGRSDEAAEAFRKALRILEPLVAPSMKTHSCERRLAWILATCPVVGFRDPPRAVMLAKQFMLDGPETARKRRILGIAQYRAGDYAAAMESLRKSMELSNGGDAQQWLFLAMSYWQKADRQQAREWYDKAAAWIEKNRPADEEYVRFRVEAARLLGVQTPDEEKGDAVDGTGGARK